MGSVCDTQKDDIEYHQAASGYRWYVVVICMVAYIFSYVDRQILALLVDPIRLDLSLSDTQFSLILGFAFSLFYATMGIPIAILSDRRSRPAIISLGIFLWSLATAGCGLARSFFHLFVMRMAVGAGEASLSPATYSMIADLFPRDKLGRALSVFAMGSFIGGGLALTIGGMVITLVSSIGDIQVQLFGILWEIKPWQFTFLIIGIPGILLALIFILTVKDPGRKEINKNISGSFPTGDKKNIIFSDVWAYIRCNKKTILSHFSGFSFAALTLFGIMSWSPAFYMRKFGLAPDVAGMYLGVIMLTFNTLGTFSSGWLADFFQKKGFIDAPMRAGMWGGVGLLVPACLFPIVGNLYLSLALLAVASFFASFPIAPSAIALQLLVPNRMRAQFSALFLFVSNIFGLGVGTTLIALITDYVFADDGAVGYSIAMVCLVAVLLQIVILARGLKYYRASVC